MGELLGYAAPTLASTRPVSKERLRTLGLVALLSTAVVVINPRGVGIAGFHQFDNDVPDDLKAELEEVRQQIIAGVISTK